MAVGDIVTGEFLQRKNSPVRKQRFWEIRFRNRIRQMVNILINQAHNLWSLMCRPQITRQTLDYAG